MYLSTNDGTDNAYDDDNSQIQLTNTLSVTSNPSQSSSPSYPTLLVIDDNSNSDDSSLNTTTNIPSNTMSPTAQTAHVQVTSSSPSSTIDASNDTPDQQRRRNSSIAKLLGGRPLNNQQYEEIHQQILVDQTAQNKTDSDNGTDNEIQRSRSSITRTLLMNSERKNSTSTTATKGRPISPPFSKDFEYLIRRELDIEHAPSTFNRNNSSPSVFQNLNGARKTPPVNAQSSSNSNLKRKRPNPKQTVSTTPTTTTTTPTATANKTTSHAPFAIRDPFELDSSLPPLVPPMNPITIHRPHHHQNGLFRFDAPHRHPYQHHQQQYSLPMNNSPTTNPSSFTCRKLNINSPVYAQYKMHPDRIPTTSSSSSSMPSSCNCCRYHPTIELALPTPVSTLSTHTSSPSITTHNTNGTSARKTKTIYTQPDIYEIPVQRPCSTISHQSSTSSSSSSSSSPGLSAPLKKRLLHAYTNEQRPSSSL